MNIPLKIITRLPLEELWQEDNLMMNARERFLPEDDIKTLLRIGAVQFVVADLGFAPQWVPVGECHAFWKAELQPHLAAPNSKIRLEEFPAEYCYVASQWRNPNGDVPIVVCEKCH